MHDGFREIYITGGEPFVHPEIVSLIEYASDRLPTVVLTNAMLFTGRRRGARAPRPTAAGAVEVCDVVVVPELTITADGAHWHPLGADVDSCPDFLVARGEVSLAEAKRLVIERSLALREAAHASRPARFAARCDPERCDGRRGARP